MSVWFLRDDLQDHGGGKVAWLGMEIEGWERLAGGWGVGGVVEAGRQAVDSEWLLVSMNVGWSLPSASTRAGRTVLEYRPSGLILLCWTCMFFFSPQKKQTITKHSLQLAPQKL